MQSIQYPMKVHAVKLEYKRQKLEKMTKGYFKTINDVRKVYITFNPDNPKPTPSHPRRLRTDTRLGRNYTEKINSYLALKTEYETLLNDWNSRYSFAPPIVNFPIVQFLDPHAMNNDYFNNQLDNMGKYKPDNPTISKHGKMKSKNEFIGAELLEQMDIPFKYEPELYLEGDNEMINPDYLINFYEIDRCAYLEVLGMTDKLDYFVRNACKIYNFSKNMYRPGREVIYVILYDKSNFDKEYFISQILSAYNDMIPDEALIWEPEKDAV